MKSVARVDPAANHGHTGALRYGLSSSYGARSEDGAAAGFTSCVASMRTRYRGNG